MKVISFGEGSCDKIRRYLDSYLSNELLVETNHEVLRHLEQCAACSAELEMGARIRTQLKGAVQRQAVPLDLAAGIRERLQAGANRASLFSAEWTRWAAAVAAVLVVAVGTVWMTRSRPGMPDIADRRSQDVYIQKVSQTIASVLRVGLGDHIHCSVFRKYPKNPPALEQMAEKMGPAYKGLVPLVKAAVPGQYRMLMAHQCGYAGRRYVHLTLHDGSRLISLVITRKQEGESLEALQPVLQASGVAVYQAAAERYEVAGFETDQYLAFVVSDLNAKNNLQLAATLAPSVHEFLTKAQG